MSESIVNKIADLVWRAGVCSDRAETKAHAEELLGGHRDEVLHETPLFLAEYDSVPSEIFLTADQARAMCDDIAAATAGGMCWDWSRDETGAYVQFWVHEDDDRPLNLTGGLVTELHVQRPDAAGSGTGAEDGAR
ncbi:hypothetical protein [Streptomyces sp. NPDC051994]|uniref:hypothetical protein n=1 Tax=unclassified Streptomyces TaxID=2593676 RepID=UPI00341FAEF0